MALPLAVSLAVASCDFLTSGTVPGNGEDPDAPVTPPEPETPSTGVVRPQAQPETNASGVAGSGSMVVAGGTYSEGGSVEPAEASGMTALLVIGNADFDFREYSEAREQLERTGHDVKVAAAQQSISTPKPGTAKAGGGTVMPDVALANADPALFDALLIVGGWGASSYLYAFDGAMTNASYAPLPEAAARFNEIVATFLAQDKYVAAIGYGVAALAWARVDEMSPLSGRTVVASEKGTPACVVDGRAYEDDELPVRHHLERNGATMSEAGAVGNPATDADDVATDGRIVTAQNAEAAAELGRTLGTLMREWLESHPRPAADDAAASLSSPENP